jgi:hypothetical protein
MKIQRATILRNIIHPILALGLTLSAFALDDRSEEPKPQEEPKPKPAHKPDLVPLSLVLKHDYSNANGHGYSATISVANFGTADCYQYFVCHFGYKVLATNDPAKYPVGYSTHDSDYISYPYGLQALEVVEQSENACFHIPAAVTAAEVFLIVDRPFDYNSPDPITWVDDIGKDYIGDVEELDEDNNVYQAKPLYFSEYNPQKPVEPPVVQRVPLKLRGK